MACPICGSNDQRVDLYGNLVCSCGESLDREEIEEAFTEQPESWYDDYENETEYRDYQDYWKING